MSSLATQTPVEIDTKLAVLWEQEQKKKAYLESYEASIAKDEARMAKDAAAGREPFAPQYGGFVASAAKLREEIVAIMRESEPFEDEYSARQWSRFFLVTNANGHIHTSMSCSTCFHDTQFGWLPQYSGMTAEEIVAVESYRCCTVCMPIAPAEQKAALAKRTKEQREAKAAERKAKADAKEIKARERAVKLLDKAEKEIEKLGGREVFFAEYSDHGHDGRKSLYQATFDMQQTVGDILVDIIKLSSDEKSRRWVTINPVVKQVARERGLIK